MVAIKEEQTYVKLNLSHCSQASGKGRGEGFGTDNYCKLPEMIFNDLKINIDEQHYYIRALRKSFITQNFKKVRPNRVFGEVRLSSSDQIYYYYL